MTGTRSGPRPGEPPVHEPGHVLLPGYEVVAFLSRGKRLDVYDAWSDARQCRVIVKLLRPDRRDRRSRTKLLREGRLLCELTHPHLVRGYELWEPELAVVMETLTGSTLERLIDSRWRWRRRMRPGDLVLLGIQLGSVVGHLHAHGAIHGDLKPSNMVVEAGKVKLFDLSLARPPGESRAGSGTRAYLAPEQARGDPVSAATDVWGIGMVLFEAATAQAPFEHLDVRSDRESWDDRSYPQAVHRAPAVRRFRRRLPVSLAAIIDSCLAPDPGARPSMDELCNALVAFAGSDLRRPAVADPEPDGATASAEAAPAA